MGKRIRSTRQYSRRWVIVLKLLRRRCFMTHNCSRKLRKQQQCDLVWFKCCRMTSNDVDAVTENRRIDDETVVNLALQLGLSNSNTTTKFCECTPGGANASSPHCHLVNQDYNITTLTELFCNDDHRLQLQQQVDTRVFVVYRLILC